MAKKKYKSLGVRIKRLREERDMSLQTLANETGFSSQFLQDVEGEHRIPPVGALLKIARALGVESGLLLKEEDEAAEEKRRAETRKRTDNYSYRMLTPDVAHKHLKAFHVSIDPHTHHKGVSYQHEGEEFIYVLQGEVEVTIGENMNRIHQGESLHFNSSVTHKLKNSGAAPTELIVVLYTP